MYNSEQKKKYQEIAEDILADIKKGVYQIGENIPPIRQLAKKYHVNPQTVNKATAYLASLGYLAPRQGSGSMVTVPKPRSDSQIFVPMLLDSFRSKMIDQPDCSLTYHCKDIYLSYLMNINQLGYKARFYVFEKDKPELNQEFVQDVSKMTGVIVQGSLPDEYFYFLTEKNIPIVLINREPPEGVKGKIGSVAIDTSHITQCINYLISLNHKKILFCQSDEYEKSFAYFQRRNTAQKALTEWEGDFDVELREFRFNSQDKRSIDEFLTLKKEGFSAAFCYNDISALGLYSVIQKLKFRIPIDFSVIGIDDIFASQLATPPLTTIRINRPRLVSMALELFEKLNNTTGSIYLQETLATEIVFRKSVFTFTK